jgi:GH43 family beta-xylosidase
MYVLHNDNANPFKGQWTLTKLSDPTNDQWAIDGIVFKNQQHLYFIWSGWDGKLNTDQSLFIAPMDSPTHISGKRVKIATPEYPWETNTTPKVNEGPEIIVKNNTISLVYSGSGSWTDTYALGLVTANVNADLLNPASWTKKSDPIFKSGNGLFGPGHHSFTKSPDNLEDWIVYHTARWQGSGWTRNIRAQKFTWSSDDTPFLGTPVNPNSPIALPSGEVLHERYEAELAVLGGGSQVISSPTSSKGMKVGNLQSNNDYVEFNIQASSEGVYNLTARVANGEAASDRAVIQVLVNQNPAPELYVVNSGWETWSNSSTKVNLKKGLNKIRLYQERSNAEIDCIDIYR